MYVYCECATRSGSGNGGEKLYYTRERAFLCDVRLCDEKMEDASLSKMLFDKIIFLVNLSFRVCVCSTPTPFRHVLH